VLEEVVGSGSSCCLNSARGDGKMAVAHHTEWLEALAVVLALQ
jgi:hypothetical protein